MDGNIRQIKIQCFGGFHFEIDGKVIHHFSTDKARALLVYLAVEAPRSFRRSHLAGMFWSEFTEEQALHNLRQTLLRLRKTLPSDANQPPVLLTIQDTVSINPEVSLWVDVNAFRTAYQTSLTNFSKDQHFDRLNFLQLNSAITLFKSPFLDRFHLDESWLFDEWVMTIREDTNQKATEMLILLREVYERRADYVQASELADRIIKLMPWDETSHTNSMRLYALRKQWGLAKKRYVQLRDYLHDNFNIEPDPSITKLIMRIRHLSLTNGSLQPLIPPIACRLPELTASFFGREQEKNDLVGMFANPKIRLVTIIGMGGIGKTRLSIEIGHLLHGLYQHGIFFVRLRDISSLEGVIHKIADILDLPFSSGTTHQRQLMDSLREKRCLLILDSYEHLFDKQGTREFLAEILNYAPGVKLLVTSRERLNLQEEHTFPLVGLLSYHDFPEESHPCDSSDALALFLDRARQVDPQYAQDTHTLHLVHKLCQIVEGHPLSIELMASATNTLAVPDLLTDIESSLLTFESPLLNASPEQRSLIVVLERSWALLSADQQSTLMKLACFRATFTTEAAIAVAQTSKTTLSALVEKCFLRRDRFTRFNFHQIVRPFVRQKSIEANLYQDTLFAHAFYYLDFFQGMVESNLSILTENIFKEIETDLENFKDAWYHMIYNSQFQSIIPGIEPLYQFFNSRSRFQDGIDLFQVTLQAAEKSNQLDTIKGKLANRIGSLAHRLRLKDFSFQMFTYGLYVFEDQDDQRELGLALIGLGNFYLRTKQFHLAQQQAQRGLAAFQDIGDIANQAVSYELLGLIYNRTANFPRAKEMLTLAIDLSRQINDQRGMISSLNQLGDLACNEGDFESAERYFLESLDYSRSFQDRFNQAILLNNLASIYHPRKAYDQEAAVLQESLTICREIGDQDGEAIALNNLAELAVVQGNHQLAVDFCEQALSIALSLGEEWTIIVIYDILGEAYLGLKDFDTAQRCFTKALQMAYQIDAWDLVTRVMVNHAGVYIARGEEETARRLLKAALSHSGILYEYKVKAMAWLETHGFDLPQEKNESLLFEVLEKDYHLQTKQL